MSNASSATYLPHDDQSQDLEKQIKQSQNYLSHPFEVDLTPDEHPTSMTTARKWLIVVVISLGSLCVTCSATAASFAEMGMAEEFHVSHIVTILTISLFVVGLGVGPLVVGPLSEVYGRNIIYRVSFTLLFVFAWPIAFAPNIAVMLVFRFLSGLCGSTFLSVAGGTVSDLFKDESVANPMALYTLSSFVGPALGPLYSGFVNQNTNWRWTFRALLIWTFFETVALYLIPETFAPVLRKWKAAKLRKSTGNPSYWAPLDRHDADLMKSILVSCYKPFELIFCDRMVLLLNTWTSLILGILYLTFQAFPIIFERNHGFNMQETGMAFLGISLGMILAIPTQGYFNHFVNATKTPESHLHKAEMGGILVPVGLWILAFASRPPVHWIVPILGSIPFGSGIYLVFTSVFTFLVTAYRPIAATALASNSAMRFGFAAVFPLFAGFMYNALGTVGATALLAGIMTAVAPLPFIFRRIGARLRQNSRFAAQT